VSLTASAYIFCRHACFWAHQLHCSSCQGSCIRSDDLGPTDAHCIDILHHTDSDSTHWHCRTAPPAHYTADHLRQDHPAWWISVSFEGIQTRSMLNKTDVLFLRRDTVFRLSSGARNSPASRCMWSLVSKHILYCTARNSPSQSSAIQLFPPSSMDLEPHTFS
jgi:hypothetical protein